MEKCFVELSGSDRELRTWCEQFPMHSDPCLSEFTVPSAGAATKQVYGICSRRFDGVEDDNAILDIADELLLLMRGWVITSQGWSNGPANCTLGAVYRLGDDGIFIGHTIVRVKTCHLVLSAPSVSAEGAVYGPDGQIRREDPQPTQGQRIIDDGGENIKAALKYVAAIEQEDWDQLYRAFDALGKVGGLKGAGITHKKSVRLVQTLNLHRKHHPQPLDGPPLQFSEALALILRAIRRHNP